MTKPVIIDRINLRLPGGWQGDPSQLARRVAEQLQHQAVELSSSKRLDLSLKGPFGGESRRVAGALAHRLKAVDGAGGRGGKRS